MSTFESYCKYRYKEDREVCVSVMYSFIGIYSESRMVNAHTIGGHLTTEPEKVMATCSYILARDHFGNLRKFYNFLDVKIIDNLVVELEWIKI